MSDPVGNLWYCFTPLVSYIADTPEACMLSCVHGLTSPVMMATYIGFGDLDRHPPCTAAITLAQLASVMAHCDVNDVDAFFAMCEEFCLSGVSHPFWCNWLLAEPSRFLTPEGLHHWFHEFWDHDFKWCVEALGSAELDFRFSILLSITGLCHFSSGVTKLKQVTSWTQRDILRYIVVVIAGAADPLIVTAIRALVDFRYLSQAPHITTTTCDKIQSALTEFHNHKHVILDGGLRRGQMTGVALDHWQIPKLELMQSIVPSIEQVGSLLQWLADTTEHAHIEVIKDPASRTNNQNYNSQICRYLDCTEKCWQFNTAVALRATESMATTNEGFANENSDLDSEAGNNDTGADKDDSTNDVLSDIWAPKRQSTNYFHVATNAFPNTPPLTFIVLVSTAIHLNVRYSMCGSMDLIIETFGLPDLWGVLGDYLVRDGTSAQNFHSFGRLRCSSCNTHLPFKDLQVWFKVCIQ